MRAFSRAVVLRTAFSAAVTATLTLATLGLQAGGALAQSPPSLQQYPLYDRIFGPGGAVFPDYVTPSEPGISYVTGSGAGTKGGIFAAGTTDFNCQQTQVPTIAILDKPAGSKVAVRYGRFLATGTDGGSRGTGGGSTKCLGQQLKGLVVTYRGPRGSGRSVTLRVTYPFLGAWYDHTVPVPAR